MGNARTSLNANIARREVPTIIQKILNLMNNDNDSGNDKNTTNSCGTSMINEEQIEILQVTITFTKDKGIPLHHLKWGVTHTNMHSHWRSHVVQ